VGDWLFGRWTLLLQHSRRRGGRGPPLGAPNPTPAALNPRPAHINKTPYQKKVVLPDQLLESVFSGYYEIYLYEFTERSEVASINRCVYNLGTRAVLLRMLQEQPLFDVRMAYDKRPRSNGSCDYELVLEFHRRLGPASPRFSSSTP
jgi:hypothetical protein